MAERHSKDTPTDNEGVGTSTEVKPVADAPFVGVDPIYQNYADVTGKPFVAEEGPEAEADKLALERERLANLDAAHPVRPAAPGPDDETRKQIDAARQDREKRRLEQHPELAGK